MMTHDMLTNNLEDQEELHDSFSIGKPFSSENPTQQNRPTMQTYNSTTTTTASKNNMAPHLISDWIEESKRMVRDEVQNHVLVKTDEKERRSKDTFQTKRAVCSTPNCRRTTSMFCPGCPAPTARDKAWICRHCEPNHMAYVMAQNPLIGDK